MYVYVGEVHTSFTLVHEVKIGDKIYNIPPGCSTLDRDVNADDYIYAKLPREYDWYNYGKVSDFLYHARVGFELWLFSKNKNPVSLQQSSSTNTAMNSEAKKSKNKWW